MRVIEPGINFNTYNNNHSSSNRIYSKSAISRVGQRAMDLLHFAPKISSQSCMGWTRETKCSVRNAE